MSLFAQFLSSFLHRGIEVAFAFWGGLDFRVYFKSVPFLCEKCPFLSYLGCLEEAINPIAKTGSFFARNWKLVDKLWSLPPQFKKMLCADLLQYFVFCWKMLFSLQPNNLGQAKPGPGPALQGLCFWSKISSETVHCTVGVCFSLCITIKLEDNETNYFSIISLLIRSYGICCWWLCYKYLTKVGYLTY